MGVRGWQKTSYEPPSDIKHWRSHMNDANDLVTSQPLIDVSDIPHCQWIGMSAIEISHLPLVKAGIIASLNSPSHLYMHDYLTHRN